jgi:hypothetical protein
MGVTMLRKSSQLAELALPRKVILVDVAVIVELRVFAELHQFVPHAVAVLVVQALQAVQPEDQVDQVDQDEGLEEGLRLVAGKVRKLVIVSAEDVQPRDDALGCQHQQQVGDPGTLDEGFHSGADALAAGDHVHHEGQQTDRQRAQPHSHQRPPVGLRPENCHIEEQDRPDQVSRAVGEPLHPQQGQEEHCQHS